ncbi:MAG: hypothetical protein ACJ8AW_27260 [Rhodopila sp.]
MPTLVWNNFLAGWLCLVLLSLALGIFVMSSKRPRDTTWRVAVAGCAVASIVSIVMLLYDTSIWLVIH